MKQINESELNELQSQNKKILLEIYTSWCPSCKVLLPRLENMESNYSEVVFAKMNAEENTEYAMNLGIRSVPTVIVYDGKNIVNKSSGANPDSFYKEILNQIQ